MENKRGFIGIILVSALILSLIFLIFTLYYIYFRDNQKAGYNGGSGLEYPSPKKYPAGVKRDSYFQNYSSATENSSVKKDPCENLEDNYTLPDFETAQTIASNNQFVKDIPKKGKIIIKFYHFVGNCRVFDKTYFLSDGKIEEKDAEADIEILISTDYVDKIKENNFCELIDEARKNGDLGYTVNIGVIDFIWTYRGLLKYKECVEEGNLGSISPLFIIKKSIDAAFDKVKSLF